MSSKKRKALSADELRAQIAALQDQIKHKSKALRDEERRTDTRKKVLMGIVLQKWVEEGKVSQDEVTAGLDKYLERDGDRAVFGLAPKVSDNVSDKASTETASQSSGKKKPSPAPQSSSAKGKSKTSPPDQPMKTSPGKPLKEVNQQSLQSEFEM